LTTTDLLSTTGKVTTIDIVVDQGLRYTHTPMMIKLGNFNNEFRLMDAYKDKFNYIKNNITPNEVIKIYYRTAFQSFFGIGERYDIFQIEKNGQILFPFSATKNENINSFWGLLFLTAFALGISFLIKPKK
jgi:hypothetical protein